jgi:hypothetical protein
MRDRMEKQYSVFRSNIQNKERKRKEKRKKKKEKRKKKKKKKTEKGRRGERRKKRESDDSRFGIPESRSPQFNPGCVLLFYYFAPSTK